MREQLIEVVQRELKYPIVHFIEALTVFAIFKVSVAVGVFQSDYFDLRLVADNGVGMTGSQSI
ncbi:MAG: hypothetical protein BWY75_00828 [bacterium ADurb.Bin425]|nr:MAG: hypothetical protein BWY75_00828 [bacterium ADurb.Bin425]